MASEEFYQQGGGGQGEEISPNESEDRRKKTIIADALTRHNPNNLKEKGVRCYKAAFILHTFLNQGNLKATINPSYPENFQKLLEFGNGINRKKYPNSTVDSRYEMVKDFIGRLNITEVIATELDFEPEEFYDWLKTLATRYNTADGNNLNRLDSRINTQIISARNGYNNLSQGISLDAIYAQLQEHFEPGVGFEG